jgi:L-rhamnose mutarotase
MRKAFRMRVDPGQHDEYARRHAPIWRELEDALLAHGVRTYSIFLDPETSDLFAYVEVESDARWAAIASTDVCRRWWKHMRDIMPSNPDNSPVSRELREVFHTSGEPAAPRPWPSRRVSRIAKREPLP